MVKINSAWLIYWVWEGNESKAVTDKIITIINYRRSGKFISELIEVLYEINNSNLRETGYSTKKRSYKSKEMNSFIMCGVSPYIEARRVKNIEIFENSEGKEEIRWIQPSTYRLEEASENSRVVEATREISKHYVRNKRGLLSFAPLSSLNKSET